MMTVANTFGQEETSPPGIGGTLLDPSATQHLHGTTHASPWLAHYEPEVPHTIEIPPLTLPGLLEQTARDYPNNVATIFYSQRLTYAQLDEQAAHFAASLHSLGITVGSRVMLLLPNSPQFVVALFGALKAGAVVIPANPNATLDDLREALETSQAETVVALNSLAPRLAELRAVLPVKHLIFTAIQDYLSPLMSMVFSLQDHTPGNTGNLAIPPTPTGDTHAFLDLIKNSPANYTAPTLDPTGPALSLSTGGTTGKPGAVTLTHRNLVANALQMSSWLWDARPERRELFLAVMPFYHSYTLTVGLNLAIANAAAVVLIPQFTIKDVLRAIARHKPTIFPASSAVYNAIIRHPLVERYDLRSIRICISLYSPLPRSVAQALQGVTGARVVESYGLAETSGITHCTPIHGSHRDGSVGLPLPLTDALIVHPDTRLPLPPETVGELAVHGPQVAEVLVRGTEGTPAQPEGGWFFTGDLARMDADGYFYVLDRRDDVILIGGQEVYPREVEEVLASCEKVQTVVVTRALAPGSSGDYIVKAYVVLKPDMEVSEAELRQYCRENLAEYKVPARIEFREALPTNAVGKYLRRQLIEEQTPDTPY